MTLLVAVLLPAMISLGFWQLRRADENRGLLLLAEQRRQRPPVPIEQLPLADLAEVFSAGQAEEWQHRQVSLQGQWQPQEFLLENQLDAARNGYHVIGVVLLASGQRVLVNRGWVAAPALRSELPKYPAVAREVTEIGEIYVAAHVMVDGPVFAEPGWPRRIGRLSIPGIARELDSELLPVIVRLRESSPSALTAHWLVVNIAPEKNIAYAIQWFAMSAALVVCYLVLGFRQGTPAENDQ